MIALLIGTIAHIEKSDIVVLVNNIGYTVSVSGKVIGLKNFGEEIRLWIYHHQTEAGSRLIGFLDHDEKGLFIKLLSVNGLGPKWALALLDLGQNEIMQAIASGESKRLSLAVGIGPKLASKIIVELRGTLDTETLQSISAPQRKRAPENMYSEDDQSILQSLVNMWYDRKNVEFSIWEIPPHLTGIGDRTIWCIRNLHHK